MPAGHRRRTGPPWLVCIVSVNANLKGRARNPSQKFTGAGGAAACFSFASGASRPRLLAAIVAVLPHPVFRAARMRLQAFAIREFGGDFA
jgi:hypothetical protein